MRCQISRFSQNKFLIDMDLTLSFINMLDRWLFYDSVLCHCLMDLGCVILWCFPPFICLLIFNFSFFAGRCQYLGRKLWCPWGMSTSPATETCKSKLIFVFCSCYWMNQKIGIFIWYKNSLPLFDYLGLFSWFQIFLWSL